VFEPTGKVTGIQYSVQFHQRKQLLEETAHEETTKRLFRYWNKHVFAGAPKHVHQPELDSRPGHPLSDIADEQEEAQHALAQNPREESDGEVFNWDDDFYSEPETQPNSGVPQNASPLTRAVTVQQVQPTEKRLLTTDPFVLLELESSVGTFCTRE
jgi:hypothetical protein